MLGWNPKRDAGVADLPFGAHEPLRERRLRDQERPRDLRRRQAAQHVQRQRDLSVHAQRRVAAGEDELEPFVWNRGLLVVRKRLGAGQQLHLGREGPLSPDAVDGAVARHGDEPAGRVGRHAVARPAFDRDGERILKGVLGEVEIAEDADQGREDAVALVAEDALDHRSTSGRTSTEPPIRAAGIRDATSRAASMPSASKR